MSPLGAVAAVVGSYLIGSIPTGYLVVKWLKRIDVRTMGSGNVGATNVTRVAGAWAGRAVFVLDLAKGLVAVWVLAPALATPMTLTAQLACGLAAVAGHCFPVFLKFSGGKGVATTIGVALGAVPGIAGIALAVWLACFVVWRYVSLASLAAAIAVPLLLLVTRRAMTDVVLGALLSTLIIARHRENIARLLRGSEHQFIRRG